METLKISRTELKDYDREGLEVLTYLGKALREIKNEETRKAQARVRHRSRSRI